MPTVRFSLRNLILAVTLLAMLFGAAPLLHRWYVWEPHRQALQQWADELKRLPNKCESKTIQLPNGEWLSVHTAELEIADDHLTATYSGQKVREQGFFVIPPGLWVDTVPDVIQVWQKNSR